MLTDFHGKSYDCNNLVKMLQIIIIMAIDRSLNNNFCCSTAVLVLTMASSDEKYDHQKVAQVQIIIMITDDDDDRSCDFWPHCFTPMVVMTVTDWSDNNCYHDNFILFSVLVIILKMVWHYESDIEVFGIKSHDDDDNDDDDVNSCARLWWQPGNNLYTIMKVMNVELTDMIISVTLRLHLTYDD